MGMILREAEVTYTGKRVDASRKITCGKDAHAILDAYGLPQRAQENFVVIYLNTKHACLAVQTVAVGSLGGVEVHPREVFRGAAIAGAAAVILAHNHPSGDTTPSTEDVTITQRLKQAGDLLGIPVLDHIIVAQGGSYISLAELGIL